MLAMAPHACLGAGSGVLLQPDRAAEDLKGPFEREWVNIHSPGSLGVQMVDVVRHRVVLEHRQVLLPEV